MARVDITQPVPGATWRYARSQRVEPKLSVAEAQEVFQSVQSTLADHPTQCLRYDQRWADASEKANSVTRDRATNALCVTVSITERHVPVLDYGLPESSQVLLTSRFYQIISSALAPHLAATAAAVSASDQAKRGGARGRLP